MHRIWTWLMQRSGWVTPRCVAGLDIDPELGVQLVVLHGTTKTSGFVLRAQRLAVQAQWTDEGGLARPEEVGRAVKSCLQALTCPVDALYAALPDASCVQHRLALAASLHRDDVAFQLQAEVEAQAPWLGSQVCLDYWLAEVDGAVTKNASSTCSYQVLAASRVAVQTLRDVARAAGVPLGFVGVRSQARQMPGEADGGVAPSGVTIAPPFEVALGLALKAWGHSSFNLLPYRAQAEQAARQNWWRTLARTAVTGAALFCLIAWLLHALLIRVDDSEADRAMQAVWTQAQQHQQASQEAVRRQQQQLAWLEELRTRQDGTLQWMRSLAQTSGIGLIELGVRDGSWKLQGEAVNTTQLQQFMQSLSALDVWRKPPEILRSEWTRASAGPGWVWAFRIEAQLRETP